MERKIYLLKKYHPIAKKSYLCKHNGTKESCLTYPGSGTYWKRILKKYGNKDLETEILGEFDTIEEFREVSLKLSKEWNIAESDDWANLINEDGCGSYEYMKDPSIRKKLVRVFEIVLSGKDLLD